jgi:hypothetical protein
MLTQEGSQRPIGFLRHFHGPAYRPECVNENETPVWSN